MAKFKYSDNSQGQFMVVNLREQLLPETFEWAIDVLIDKIDLSLFEQNYNNDERGAYAYPPRGLLKAILYCYSRGIISSRNIEDACINNIITKALAEDFEPDHDTIATFISSNTNAIRDLFASILIKCGELKLITGEMFAIDGCKLPSNTSKEWSGKLSDLRKKRDRLEKHIYRMLSRHQELDKDEIAKKKLAPYKKTMGDDKERRARSIRRLEKKLMRLDKFLETAEPKMGVSGEEVQSNVTDNESAFIKSPHGYIQGYNGIAIADSGNQIIISAEAVGSGPESGSFPRLLDSLKKNIKKVSHKKEPLKKSLLLADTGFFTEENLQEAKKRRINVLIPDQQFRKRDPDFEGRGHGKTEGKGNYGIEDFKYDENNDCFICPAEKVLPYKINAKLRNNEGKKYQAYQKDCGQCPLADKCIKKHKSTDEGKKSQTKTRTPRRTLYVAIKKYEENLSEKMREKIDDPAYRELYSQRQQIIEPIFSDITYCKGMNRFMLRGEEKVDAQWKLFCIVHNIGKCIKPAAKKYGKKCKKDLAINERRVG